VSNVYGEAKYGQSHPYISGRFVAEPYKQVTFTATGSSAVNAVSLEWNIGNDSGLMDSVSMTGRQTEMVFKQPGTFAIKLRALDKHGHELEVVESEIITVYGIIHFRPV
jgi:PKD repeat protein